ncbi:hypothetical protein D3C77_727600 [compost metagenome]
MPRTSSGTSGFFFCGIMLLPVQNASSSSTKRNSVLLHMTSSSLKRDKCIIRIDASARNSRMKSRSLTASKLFS